jgi:hypothetical protein
MMVLFSVGTLEYLQKGGRIGRASALLGGLLNIRPILTLEDGKIAPAPRRAAPRRRSPRSSSASRPTRRAPGRAGARLPAHPGRAAAETLRQAVRDAGVAFSDGTSTRSAP